MNHSDFRKDERGFALVSAIFILVVLSLLGAAMVKIAGVQGRTASGALQAAKAYHAARSGIEWGAERARNSAWCAAATSDNFVLEGFTVTVTCSPTAHSVYVINSEADLPGNYGTPDYIKRSLQAKVYGL
ncbi:hypothetical protein DESUT3_34640 [Desulfuromonas versatilis]|uniref:MSHA biogenesis protein MshP n=1 Tax=Desulfuromonas versatilis TaxID=2802975 RepID=A0ABN6E240_9BACT|nr:pilus assembly protein MshP [Desulfuromonas versatilis]BCR06395.1 hypothetical protein DESUT3_34640 [Desulfuromonas versatilis]